MTNSHVTFVSDTLFIFLFLKSHIIDITKEINMKRIEVLNDRAAAIGIKSADIEDGTLAGTHDD